MHPPWAVWGEGLREELGFCRCAGGKRAGTACVTLAQPACGRCLTRFPSRSNGKCCQCMCKSSRAHGVNVVSLPRRIMRHGMYSWGCVQGGEAAECCCFPLRLILQIGLCWETTAVNFIYLFIYFYSWAYHLLIAYLLGHLSETQNLIWGVLWGLPGWVTFLLRITNSELKHL